jgi:uncharacterized membrane protein YsdA (DUF1294 family)/cold shock CspA family protein
MHLNKPRSMDSRHKFEGTLKTWNDDRGFGFIEPLQGGQEIFVHIKAFAARSGRPVVNQLLSFEVEIGPQGKKRAKNVQAVRSRRPANPVRSEVPANWSVASLWAIPAFVAVYVIVAWLRPVPPIYAIGYGMASVVCFFAYAFDKSAARRRAWRTKESTLLLLGLAGGWPGAILAQQLLRHKSTKAAFRSVFWVTVVLNVAAFVALNFGWLFPRR